MVEMILNELPRHSQTSLSMIATLGGCISYQTLAGCPPIASADIAELMALLAKTPIAMVNLSNEDGYLELSQEVRAIIRRIQLGLTNADVENWAKRLTLWYQGFDETRSSSPIHTAFDKEVPLVENMIAWLRDSGLVLEADLFYRAVCEPLFNRGFFEARIRCGEAVATALEVNGHTKSASWIHASYGSVMALLGSYAEAEKALHRAHSIAVKGGHKLESLRAARAMASTQYRSGNFHCARVTVESLLSDPDIDTDPSNKIDALYLKAGIDLFAYKLAEQTLDEMNELAERTPWPRARAYADLELSAIRAEQGDFASAQRMAHIALETAQRYGDRRQSGRAMLTLGKIICSRNRKLPFTEFCRGVLLVGEAYEIFLQLRMDSEASEAKATLQAHRELRLFKTMPFRFYYSNRPIGGD
jgi:tetratricopeptide (TPR) repeat protein